MRARCPDLNLTRRTFQLENSDLTLRVPKCPCSLLQAGCCCRFSGRSYVMHQNWDQVSTDLHYGPPVAKASRRSYPNDHVDKGFLDFLLADNVQLPGPQQAPQQQSSFDLQYGTSAIGALPQNAAYNDGPFMSQQHTFQWVPTPGASEPVPVTDTAPGPLVLLKVLDTSTKGWRSQQTQGILGSSLALATLLSSILESTVAVSSRTTKSSLKLKELQE
jgi:hypothetical protein